MAGRLPDEEVALAGTSGTWACQVTGQVAGRVAGQVAAGIGSGVQKGI